MRYTPLGGASVGDVMFEWKEVQLGDILLSLSILVALVTWFLTFLRDRQDRRMSYTASLIADLSTSERLAEAAFQVSRLISQKQTVDPDQLDEKTERYLVSILDFYEYLCALYHQGVLDKQTIVNLRGESMRKTFAVCADYIRAQREGPERRNIYWQYEQLVDELNQRA